MDLMCGQDAALEQMRAIDDDAPATPLEAVLHDPDLAARGVDAQAEPAQPPFQAHLRIGKDWAAGNAVRSGFGPGFVRRAGG